MAAASNIVTITAGSAKRFVTTPFSREQVARAVSAGAGVLRGVNYPGIWNPNVGPQLGTQKVWRIAGDGTTTTFSETTYSFFSNLHVGGYTGTVTESERLFVIARKVGVGYEHLELLTRVADDQAPSAGEFKTQDNAGDTEVVLGEAIEEGAALELWGTQADVVAISGGAMSANVPLEVECTDIMAAETADVIMEAIGKGGGS